jgi:hypothetical protein
MVRLSNGCCRALRAAETSTKAFQIAGLYNGVHPLVTLNSTDRRNNNDALEQLRRPPALGSGAVDSVLSPTGVSRYSRQCGSIPSVRVLFPASLVRLVFGKKLGAASSPSYGAFHCGRAVSGLYP